MKGAIKKRQGEPIDPAADSMASAKQRQAAPASDGSYVLWLFVAGERTQSLQARRNIEQICGRHLQGRCELTVFDVCKDFATALEHGVLLTPTLLLLSPLPRVTIIGNLSDTEQVLGALRLGHSNNEQ